MSIGQIGRQTALDAVAAEMTHLGLSSTLPTSVGGNVTEETIGSNGYARVSLTWASTTAADPSVLATSGGPFVFTASGGDWLSGGAIAYCVIYNSATLSAAANYRGYATISGTAPTLTDGTTLNITSVTYSLAVA